MKVTVFWGVELRGLVETDITLMMEAVSTSETSVSFYQTIWGNTPEESPSKSGVLSQ
jgi:hypothetical protein